jgi:excisionase family DNA binding protein
MPDLLTVEDVAKRLAVGRTTAFHLVASGQIKSVKIGKCRRVPEAAVDEYVESRLSAAVA